MSDDIDPNAWYWVEPPNWPKFKARGHEVVQWVNEGRIASYWPVEATLIINEQE